jgi:hypothetical protein
MKLLPRAALVTIGAAIMGAAVGTMMFAILGLFAERGFDGTFLLDTEPGDNNSYNILEIIWFFFPLTLTYSLFVSAVYADYGLAEEQAAIYRRVVIMGTVFGGASLLIFPILGPFSFGLGAVYGLGTGLCWCLVHKKTATANN